MKRILGIILVLSIIVGVCPQQKVAAKIKIYPTEAPGELVEENDKCIIDYSNTADGYVMVKYKADTDKLIKVQTIANGKKDKTYTYTLRTGKYEVIPLTEGDGSYKITVNLQIDGNKYSVVMSTSIDVTLSSQFAPYLRPNQYVNYNKNTKVVKKAASLTKKSKSELAKVKKIYNYVIKNYKYDKKLARTVKTGYLPNLNKVYKKKKGICFDYAAVMTAMLRSQGVATKLVIGYTGNAYHAWINVYSKKKGWITGAIYFNGKKWKLMDPTFASTSKSSKSIMKYIGNGRNYKAKYSY
ncbi:MAG: transglutaminase domain-containing protein [Eubacterium sp.]|nr:transglutaminase domain-containing protein [Eubacterium sp.]